MNAGSRRPITGVVAAIGITTAMDAGGLSMFSALPLFPLAGILWYWERFSRVDVGLAWGRSRDYGIAVLYPLSVLGATGLIAVLGGAADVSGADWGKAVTHVAINGAVTVIVVIITEEGFFRGWLWASLTRAGISRTRVLIWSSVIFSLWHLSAVSLDTGFDLPAAKIPVFMVNAAVMGAVWGMLRLASGSVVVASVSHGVWNGLNYELFGFGSKVGALGIADTGIFGSESGLVGLALNVVFAGVLWRGVQAR